MRRWRNELRSITEAVGDSEGLGSYTSEAKVLRTHIAWLRLSASLVGDAIYHFDSFLQYKDYGSLPSLRTGVDTYKEQPYARKALSPGPH